tara:strand:+ start:311 stop:649 length:339 start_codon:yes stop_codon:yes gene_type:complete
MNLLTLLYVFCLFYVFIPGNIIKLPAKLGKFPIILIHAFVFSIILSCTYGLVESIKVIETYSNEENNSFPSYSVMENYTSDASYNISVSESFTDASYNSVSESFTDASYNYQ